MNIANSSNCQCWRYKHPTPSQKPCQRECPTTAMLPRHQCHARSPPSRTVLLALAIHRIHKQRHHYHPSTQREGYNARRHRPGELPKKFRLQLHFYRPRQHHHLLPRAKPHLLQRPRTLSLSPLKNGRTQLKLCVIVHRTSLHMQKWTVPMSPPSKQSRLPMLPFSSTPNLLS